MARTTDADSHCPCAFCLSLSGSCQKGFRHDLTLTVQKNDRNRRERTAANTAAVPKRVKCGIHYGRDTPAPEPKKIGPRDANNSCTFCPSTSLLPFPHIVSPQLDLSPSGILSHLKQSIAEVFVVIFASTSARETLLCYCLPSAFRVRTARQRTLEESRTTSQVRPIATTRSTGLGRELFHRRMATTLTLLVVH